MSEQAVDLRSTWAVLRGRRRMLVLAALLGAVTGLVLLVLVPPAFTSTSVVLLPSVAQSGSGRAGAYDADTQVLIAESTEVLSGAARSSDPELSSDEVGDRIAVDVPAPSVLRITAAGATAGQAEDLAYAVSESLLAYLRETNTTLSQGRRVQLQDRLDTLSGSLATVNDEIGKTTKRIARHSPRSEAGAADAAALSDLTAVRASTLLEIDALKKQLAGEEDVAGQVGGGASMIEPASEGRRAGYATDATLRVIGCAATFVLLAALYVIVTNKRDPKLRSRDEMAAAVGIPVVASLRTRPPRSASGWAELIRGYVPDNVDGWALRQLIHGLTPADGRNREAGDPFVLTVLSVSDDAGGLAVGPQIATYIASHGITTRLVAAHPHPSASPLWAACSRSPKLDGGPAVLSVTTAPDSTADADVRVHLVVLDRESPEAPTMATTGVTTLLAVSSATLTRKNLADAVVAADLVGLLVQGIVVANPDPLDRTSGRLTPLEMPDRDLPGAIPITAGAGGKAPRRPNRPRPQRQGRQP